MSLLGGVTLAIVSVALAAAPARPTDPVCAGRNSTLHPVVIENGRVEPAVTQAGLCDRLEITNLDAQDRLIAFGPHEHHQAYDGVSERLLARGQSLTVTLNQAGDFSFHDHFVDNLAGRFSVR